MQLLKADPVSEHFTFQLEENHEGYNCVVSLTGSLIADLAKDTQEAKVDAIIRQNSRLPAANRRFVRRREELECQDCRFSAS